MAIVISSGITSTGITLTYNHMSVREGGVANSTTVNSSSILAVDSGGITNNTMVQALGSMVVSSGGSANSTTIYQYGKMIVSSGGIADNTTARNGSLFISSSGIANNTAVSGGSMFIYSGGIANNTSLSSRTGCLFISSGGIADSVTINRGSVFVSSGGSANSTTVNLWGSMNVYGTATCIIENGGYIEIANGAKATFLPNTISGIDVHEFSATIHSGTTANSVSINSKGGLIVFSGGIANNTTINSSGGLIVYSGGTANNIVINSRGTFSIFSGGIANSVTVNPDGSLYLSSSVLVKSTTILSNGKVVLSKDASADHSIVKLGGRLTLSSGTTATKTTVYSNGILQVSSGGTATEINAASGARLEMACAANTYIAGTSGGNAFEVKDGSISGVAFGNGILNVQDNGTARSIAVGSGGSLSIINGTAMHTTVETEGLLLLNSGGFASNVEVESGGSLSVTNGGTLAGIMTFNSGAKVTMTADSKLLFDISSLTPDKSISLLNDFSVISGTPDYTFTASDTQIQGKYILAREASSFNGVITVQTTNEDFLGILGVGESLNTSNASYSLSLENGELALEICTIAPKIILSGNNVTPTQSATLTASSESDGDLFFSIDNDHWMKYKNEITITDNITYYFKTTDSSGNIGTNWISFSNIDTVAPEKPTVSVDITTNTTGCVFVTATFSNDSTVKEYRLDGEEWRAYTEPVKFTENGIVSFRGTDAAGNVSEVTSYEVTNIIKVPPSKPVAEADITTPTNGDVHVSASFSGESILNEYSLDGQKWETYETAITVSENGFVFFRSTNEGGIVSEVTTIEVNNIDKNPPDKPSISTDIATITNGDVLVSATFSEDSAEKKYSLNGKEWLEYKNPVKFTENGTVFFLGVDAAGNESEVVSYTVSNIDKVAPSDPTGVRAFVERQDVALLWNGSTDEHSGVKEYVVTYSINGQEFTVRTSNTNYVLNNADFGSYSWSVQAVDFAGNESAVTTGNAFTVSGFKPYTVEYSPDNFEHVITFAVTTPSLDAFRMPTGTYQMRVKQEGSSEWLTGDPIVAPESDIEPQLIKSDADGNADVFFANAVGTWESGYLAQHVGSINDWAGTNEYAAVFGKNKLADIIEGSDDANILLMTDDDNGDALFVDDIYSALPGSVPEQQARIAQIDEIRAGFGNDIVDMTSQRFEYIGEGLTIRGGEGNDTIWVNKGDNFLFGDAGNDRIVGASGNDVIAGGIGNDRLHGGGGEDVFTFCDNWGSDNVEQLTGGSVTLWFTSGSEANWDPETLTYTDGDNSVKVSGVTADKITRIFGDDGSAQFATLSSMGAFFDATTERIFEESGKGILASL